MDIYNIKNEYIKYIKKYDSNVADNKNESRPYIGIILEIDGIKYYAPFTSPKQKHKSMHNTKDFRKICGGQLGAINFNNMIPVPDKAILPICINQEQNLQYRRLLQKQYRAIQQDWETIQTTAEKLHTLVFMSDELLTPNDRKIKQRCCNLPLLETVYENWHCNGSH